MGRGARFCEVLGLRLKAPGDRSRRAPCTFSLSDRCSVNARCSIMSAADITVGSPSSHAPPPNQGQSRQ